MILRYNYYNQRAIREMQDMALIETKDMMKAGQFKTYSYLKMMWFTRFRGCHVANILQVPRRNFLGQLSTTKIWIIDPGTSNAN